MQIIECKTYEELSDLVDRPESILAINATKRSSEQFAQDLRQVKGLVADFDGTLIDGSQWVALRAVMTPESIAKNIEQVNAYFAADERTDASELGLLFAGLNYLAESNLQLADLERYARRTSPREGAVDLVKSFGGQAKVISFGIYDFIAHWLAHHELEADIGSVRLKWHQGQMSGYWPHTAVTAANKGYMSDIFRVHRALQPEQLMVIGDTETDIAMMRPSNLGVLVIPSKDEEEGRHKYRLKFLSELWPRVGAVLFSDSLQPLVDIRLEC